MTTNPGLYVHVPFCSSICPYCDFAVVTDAERRRRRYVATLLQELDLRSTQEAGPRSCNDVESRRSEAEAEAKRRRKPWAEAGPFDTIYLGGGTPSLLDAETMAAIRERASLTEDCRIFLEANPEDVTEWKLSSWRAAGVATLSLGVQSFDDDALRFLGRRHTGDDARRAVTLARDAAFHTVSVDLIFGLPDQSLLQWRRILDAAIELEPDHVSCYQLTIHEATAFGRRMRAGTLREADNDVQADLFRETFRVLEGSGYTGYEVSNFARGESHRSRHNEKYWTHTPYVGVGPSAHSFDGRRRSWNARSLSAWERAIDSGRLPVAGEETLTEDELLLECLLLGLRTRDGLDLDDVGRRFGVDLVASNRDLVGRLCDDGLVELAGSRLRPTVEGLAVADGLAASFQLPEPRCRQTPR